MKRLLSSVCLLACAVTLTAQAVADVVLSQESTCMRIDYALSAQMETFFYASTSISRLLTVWRIRDYVSSYTPITKNNKKITFSRYFSYLSDIKK